MGTEYGREGWRKSEMRGILRSPWRNCIRPCAGDAHRHPAQALALCMRASRNASGSIRMEFHAVKNPRRPLAPSFGIFSPTWLFSLSLWGSQKSRINLGKSYFIPTWSNIYTTKILLFIVKIFFFILKFCEKNYELKHVKQFSIDICGYLKKLTSIWTKCENL